MNAYILSAMIAALIGGVVAQIVSSELIGAAMLFPS